MFGRSRRRQLRRGAVSPLLLATAAVSGLLVVSCLICAGITYIGINHQIANQLKEKYGDNAVVKEHFGEIQSAWINADDSKAIQQKEAFEKYIVYDVRGSKADGQLIIEQGEQDNLVGNKGLLRIGEEDFEL
ncbi:hypothetical protein DTL21_04055 [Bremerella cremea]|uniref:Uncharacterized protein n=2 Tax=Pirellulales TaxID=2691354 RepID=A0A2S8G629_9BACT|nr:hypothetical protein C5Y83_04055 [Blastopirellula marina]RCS51381.1 hypothetical protein DTL21_04055 [Bremerella cremea]